MPDPDGLVAEEDGVGTWRWSYTSPGGAFHLGPYHHKNRADAMKAGRAWLKEFEKQ